MHNGALARHQIQIVREFEPVPPVTVDRHKVLQILFNLLENAKHAFDGCVRSDKHVRVRVERAGGRVRISIADNGEGISRENLTRIFGQQFSTRKNGHGIGLHSSSLAAKDMGAILSAHSDGPGRGATFSLEMPVSAGSARNGTVKQRLEEVRA
jgi:signal transduction histidine kinase